MFFRLSFFSPSPAGCLVRFCCKSAKVCHDPLCSWWHQNYLASFSRLCVHENLDVPGIGQLSRSSELGQLLASLCGIIK